MNATQGRRDMDERELLPCPFCGEKAEIERYGDKRKSTIYRCTSCACFLETGEEFGHGESWNTRTPPAAVSGGAGEVVKAICATSCVKYGNGEYGFVYAEVYPIITQALADAEADAKARGAAKMQEAGVKYFEDANCPLAAMKLRSLLIADIIKGE